jgi:hypothetical protein
LGLAFVLIVFVGLAATIAVKTPAWESNDEPDHVHNIETLVAGHWYGMHLGQVHVVEAFGHKYNVGLSSSSGEEAHQPPLYYLVLAGWQRLAGLPARTPNPGGHHLNFSSGIYAHHSAADLQFLLWLRIPNVVLGGLTIWFTFLAARIITSDPWTPLVAAAFVGFLPRFVFLSAFVTNDNLVNLLGAVLTFLAVRCAVSPTRWRMALVGAVVGLLITTKLSAVPLAVIILVLAFTRGEWLRRAELIGIGVVSCVVVSSWYLIQNTVRYGDPLALGASQRYLSKIGGTGTPYDVLYRVTDPIKYIVVDVPSRFLHVFWYGSGWGEFFRWPWPVGLLLWLVLAFMLLGLIGQHEPPRILLVLGALAVAGFLSVWIVAFQTASYDPRLALGGVPALACLAALGLERWKLALRFLFPFLLLGGTIFAIQTNVLEVHWS